MKHYRDHDPIQQGLYYTRHVEAMTAEDLYDKGAIASELAARDIELDTLRNSLRIMTTWVQSALDCTVWVWDSDQRLAAMGCVIEANELLTPVDGESEHG